MQSAQPQESESSEEMPSYFVLGRDNMFRLGNLWTLKILRKDNEQKILSENYKTKFGIDPDTIETSRDISDGKLEKFEIDLISNVLNDVINQLTVLNKGQIHDTPIVYKPPMAQRFSSVQERIWNEHTFERIDQEMERLTMFQLEKEV